MGGNVREWVYNGIGANRYILGGAWDERYFSGMILNVAEAPFDRSPTNGFRLAITQDAPQVKDRARSPHAAREQRDLTSIAPISDEVFAVYRRLHDYDAGPVNAVLEERVEERSWVRERIAIDAAYRGERMALYLYLPRDTAPPYQTVVFAPGANAWSVPSIDQMGFFLEFVVSNGRAVAMPVQNGMFERRDELGFANEQWHTTAGRDRTIELHQDVRRVLDYLETRSDVDRDAFAYFGMSLGGQAAAANLAFEPRLKVAVLALGGVRTDVQFLPEIDPMSYVAHVHVPVLLLSGTLDNIFPLETSAVPFFERLASPPEHKRHVILEGGHFVPQVDLVRETLGWLDAYLGPVP